jgi:cell division protein FtsQ
MTSIDDDPPRPRARWRLVGAAAVVVVLAACPWWGTRVLRAMSFFRVRNVQVEGARFLTPADIVARLHVDTAASVWDDLGTLEARVRRHPLVRDARISRNLPGTLVVRVTEKVPVALVASPAGFTAYDGRGESLPIDPTRASVDLPILASRDTALLRLLEDVRADLPGLYARISEIRRVRAAGDGAGGGAGASGGVGRGELVVQLSSIPVRAMADVTVGRLAETIPVEEDLARRRVRVAELDLRFRDQVIARLQ